MMNLARLPRPGSPLAQLAGALITMSCSNEQPTEPTVAVAVEAPVALSIVGCEGCRRDNFTAPGGTLLENHVLEHQTQ